MIARAIAVTVLALAVTASVSATATAAPYPPDDQAAVGTSACSGQYVAEAGYFEPGETVTITVSGPDAEAISVTPAALKAKTFPTFTAGEDGSLVVDIRNNSATPGNFELTTTGSQSPARGPILFSLTASCTRGTGSEIPVAGDDSELPNTGADTTPIGLGVGMLALGALALGGVHAVRRRRV